MNVVVKSHIQERPSLRPGFARRLFWCHKHDGSLLPPPTVSHNLRNAWGSLNYRINSKGKRTFTLLVQYLECLPTLHSRLLYQNRPRRQWIKIVRPLCGEGILGTRYIDFCQVGLPQIYISQAGMPKDDVGQVGSVQVSMPKMGVTQIRVTQIGLSQVGFNKFGSSQVGAFQVSALKT